MQNTNGILFSIPHYQGSILECLIISILATLAMTVFSILISYLYKKNFNEANLISKIVGHHIKDAPNWLNIIIGYFLHFLVGFVFTSIHLFLYLLITPAWYNAIFLGLMNALIGIVVWYISIKIYNDVLFVEIGSFLYQLIGAHVVFSLVILWMYILPRLQL